MSYAYTTANREDPAQYPIRFNTTELLTFNPFRAFESGYLFGPNTNGLPFHEPAPGSSLAFWDMTKSPWFYRRSTDAGSTYWSAIAATSQLDQNRSGVVASSTTPYPSLGHVARRSQCWSFTHGAAVLKEVSGSDVSDITGTVDLVRSGSWLYGFFSRDDPNNAARSGLWMVRASLGALSNKSCTGSPDPWSGTSPCLSWSVAIRLASGPRAHASAQLFNGALFVSSTHATTGDIYMTRYTPQANGNLTFHSYPARPAGPLQSHRALGAPELTILHAFRRAPELALMWRSLENTAPYKDAIMARRYIPTTNAFTAPELQRPVGGSAGSTITSLAAPAALAWPSPEDPTMLSQDKRRTLGIFPESTTSSKCGMYTLCNDLSCCEDTGDGCCNNPTCTPPPQAWGQTSYYDGAGLQENVACHVKAGLAYRQLRSLNGQPLGWKGHVMVSSLDAIQGDIRPVFLGLSEMTSDARVPGHTTPAPAWRASPLIDYAQNASHGAHPDGNVALYSDPSVASVFALGVIGPERRLEFWPHADAAPDHGFAVGNDFRVMEGEACRLTRFPTNAYQLVASPPGDPANNADNYCGTFTVQSLLP